jgi:Holliday junction resolvase RusA-like endonuclease
MTTLTIDVTGTPAPQGSHRGFVNPKSGRVIITQDNKKTKPWRQDVVAAAHNTVAEHPWDVPTGPVSVGITFHIARPRYHYRTGKHANELRHNAPAYVDKKPDLDKLVRATLDALTTSAVIKDDAQVATLEVSKRYTTGATGARITITPLDSAAPVTSSPTGAAEPAPAGALF